MRKILLGIMIFLSISCFAQQLKIEGDISHFESTKQYRIQVGSYREIANAERTFYSLQRTGLNPLYEDCMGYRRVILAGFDTRDFPLLFELIYYAGFNTVWITEEENYAGFWPTEADMARQAGTAETAGTDAEERVVDESLPRLAAPADRLPEDGFPIDVDYLKTRQGITFNWSPVTGANAYIFSLYQQTGNGRRQIIRRIPENITRWTMTDLSRLDRGTFIWRVEAVSINQNGLIERSGEIEDNMLIIDFPPTAWIQTEETGILYGK